MQDAAAIEHACVQFQLTTNPQERAAAESVIQAFRNLENPYALCQQLLAHSTQPLVHFHALSVIRDALLREWGTLSKEFIMQTREYLMKYSSPNYRALVAQTLALICKRSWWDQNEDRPYFDQDPFFAHISSLIQSNDVHLLFNGVLLLQPLIVEFSTSSKSFQMQLSWEYHLYCQKSFETSKLPEIFAFLVALLRKVATAVSPASPPSEEIVSILDNILQVIIEILDWRFNQSVIDYLTTTYKSISTTSVNPGPTWRPLLVDSPDLRDILFTLYPLVRNHSTIAHTVRYVILLLCSVTGPIFTSPEVKTEYMTRLLTGIMHLLSSVTTLQKPEDMLELGGFSQILQRFVSNFKLDSLAGLPFDAFRAFLMEYVRITTLSLQGLRASVAGGNEDLEGELEVESFDLLLEGWVSLSNDTEKIMRQKNTQGYNLPLYVQEGPFRILAECAGHLFGLYVSTRLEMARTGISKQDLDDDENVQPDKIKYAGQLEGIAFLGRLEPMTSSTTLCNHLNERLSALSQGHQSDEILEETHWLVLLAGFLLADEGDGEVPQVPYFINIASALSTNTPGTEDVVVALTSCVLRVAELENQNQKNSRTLSPLLGDTLIWFLTRWSRSYLLLQPSSSIQLSPSLLHAYGSGQGQGGIVVLDAILLKAALNFYASRAETELMLATCELLNILAQTQAPKYLHLLRERDAWPILMAAWRDLKGSLAASVLGNLVSALVTFSVLAGGDLATQLLADIAVPLNSRLTALLTPAKQTTQVISESLCVLDGICKAGKGRAGEWVMRAMAAYGTVLATVISAFSIHADLVKLALSVFADFTDVQLEHIPEESVLAFYAMMRAAIQAYAREVAATPAKSRDEIRERYKCAKVIFHTLNTLSSASPNCPSAQTTHVIFDGLAAMLPFLAGAQGAELLQFPKLCRLFFMTVSYVISEQPLSLIHLPTDLYHTLLRALEFGVGHHDVTISRNSLEAVTAIATAYRDKPEMLAGAGNTVVEILAHFLESVLKILLYGESAVDDILVPTSGALYPLIQCIPDRYPIVVQNLLSSASPAARERLLAAFRALPVPQRGDNASSAEAKFCDALGTFVSNARGFLRAR